VLQAAIAAVDAGELVLRACDTPDVMSALQLAAAVDVVAAGKAAGAMLNAFAAASSVPLRNVMGVGPATPDMLPAGTTWHVGGHPLPNGGSIAAAAAALSIADRMTPGDLLVVLLSGGGSALMASPADGVTLQDKQDTAHRLMAHGADIHELNTVRKHLSAIKGGQLAARAQGAVLTLAISDVVGDDLSVIASGPTVADSSTFVAAMDVIERRGGAREYPDAVVARLRAGIDGRVSETPKADDPALSRTRAYVVGRQRGAIDGARVMAASLGYHVVVLDEPVTGEARTAAPEYVRQVADRIAAQPRPLCVISAGETTVTVTGAGVGGRNQEFALATMPALDALGLVAAVASFGTDGVDGPTDAAGAIVDSSTSARATLHGLDAMAYLSDNNSYAFFDRLGDLIRTGPTGTNVGDLQVMLIA
jgi:hydroxypyruvate reductase